MFAAFDEGSSVVAPEELGSYGSRVRTMHVDSSYDRRVKAVSDRAMHLLKLHASDDAVGAKRDFLRFNLGSGLSWLEQHPNLSQASSKDGEVVVLYKGNFHVPPVHSAEAAHDAFVRGEDPDMYQNPCNARRMLDYYLWSDGFRMGAGAGSSSSSPDHTFAVEKLRQLSGGFAFVLFDRAKHRLVAARDAAGEEDLFWGVCSDGEEGGMLCFSDTLHTPAMEECMFSATHFPKGMVLVAQGSAAWRAPPGSKLVVGPSRPGVSKLHSFTKPQNLVRAVPRVNSSGALCGAVFRVDSTADLLMSGNLASAMQRVSSFKELVAL